MNKEQLEAFLDKKPGYVKKGSKALEKLLAERGISLVGVSNSDIKEILRDRTPSKKKASKTLKIMTYDIETSQVVAHLWGTGKQFVAHDRIKTEQQILSVAWKWLGDDTVHSLKWSMKKRNDKKLVADFLKEYNSADMVIGWNNNSYDNKLIHARAMKYNFDVNTLVKSYDVMRQAKKVFKLASFSMAYVSRYLGMSGKLNYSGGLAMWEAIQFGTKKDAKDAMKVMIAYNEQDVILTEDIYLRLRKYLGSVIHTGVIQGKSKMTCPNCGGDHTELHHTTVTPAGAIQRVMYCKDDKVKFKVSNSEYLKSL